MCICICVYMYMCVYIYTTLGDSKNYVRGYCLDLPRFEEWLSD